MRAPCLQRGVLSAVLFVGFGTTGAVTLYGLDDGPALPVVDTPVASMLDTPPAGIDASSSLAASIEADHWFDGRPIRPVSRLWMKVTAYSPDARSCAPFADGITASGYSIRTNAMKLVAADTKLLPLGTLVSVPGYDDGHVVPVLDRGGRIKGPRLDVLYPTHEEALVWGVRHMPVTIWEYVDGEGTGY